MICIQVSVAPKSEVLFVCLFVFSIVQPYIQKVGVKWGRPEIEIERG